MDRRWPLLSFFGSVVGFYLLLIRNPDIKIGAKEQEWFVIAVWYAALNFMPFMLICNSLLGNQIKDMCKDSWFLNAFLSFIFLVIPAIIDHLAQYPEFHINVKDVKQHNSQKRYELFAACSFAISSWGLSKTYDLTFESGLFSVCLEHAMKFSLAIVNKTGRKRDIVFILGTFCFCLMIILWRKYLEKNKDRDIARQRNDQSPDNTNTNNRSPNNRTDGADDSFSASDTSDSQASDIGPIGRLSLNQPNQPGEITARNWDRTPGDCRVQDGNSQRDVRQESWDITEQNRESVPPRLYNDSSSNSGDTEDGVEEEREDEEVPSASKFEVKESKDTEGTSASGGCVGKIEENEVERHEIENDERDSGYMEMAGSCGFRGYEKGDVPLLPLKSDNMIHGETQTERSKYQSQEGSDHGYKIDDNLLQVMNSLKVDKDDKDDDDDGSDNKSSDSDDSQIGRGCTHGVGRRHKGPGQESDYQEQENVRPLSDDITKIASDSNSEDGDIPILLSESKKKEGGLRKMEDDIPLNYEGITKHFSDEETNKLYGNINDDSSDDEGSDDNDFNSGTGCKVRVGWRRRNKCLVKEGKDTTNSDNLRTEQWMQRNQNPISECTAPRAIIGELSDDDKDDSSDDEGSNGDDFNGKGGSKDGVGQTGRNKRLVKVGKDITNLDESREICLGLPINPKWNCINFLPISPSSVISAKTSMLSEDDNNSSDDKGSGGHDFNSWAAWKAGVGQRGRYILDESQLASNSSGDRGSYGHNFNSGTASEVGEELRYLHWKPYPLIYLPSKLCPENFIQLHLPERKLTRPWDRIQDLGNLKELDFTGCKFLELLPDMSKFTKLEILNLSSCTNLRSVPPSILSNRNLVKLYLSNCQWLQSSVKGKDISISDNLRAKLPKKKKQKQLQTVRPKVDCDGSELKIQEVPSSFNAAAMERITKLASKTPVVIFTKSSCCLCHSIKQLIFQIGVNPSVYELDEIHRGREIEQALRRLGCCPSVPALFIDGEFVGGAKEVLSLHVEGSLIPRLKREGILPVLKTSDLKSRL